MDVAGGGVWNGGTPGSGGCSTAGAAGASSGDGTGNSATDGFGGGSGSYNNQYYSGGDGGSGVVIISYDDATSQNSSFPQISNILYEFDNGQETSLVYSDTSGTSELGVNTAHEALAMEIEAGNSAIGEEINTVKMKLVRNGSPSTTYYFKVWDSDGNEKATSEAKSSSGFTFPCSSSTWYEWQLDKTVTLEQGDKIGIEESGGTGSDHINVCYDGSAPSNFKAVQRISGVWSDETSATSFQMEFDSSLDIFNQATLSNYSPTTTVDEDWSACTTTDCDGTWSSSGVYAEVNTNDNVAELDSNAGIVHDLTFNLGSAVGDNWTLTWTHETTAITHTGGGGSKIGVGLTSGTSGTDDFVLFYNMAQASPNDDSDIQVGNGATMLSGGADIDYSTSPNVSTEYMKLESFSGRNFILTMYDDVDRTIVDERIHHSESGIAGFDTLILRSHGASGGSDINAKISDIKLYVDFAILDFHADGTISDATTSISGIRNEAYSFDGINDYIETKNIIQTDSNTPMTIVMWVYPEETTEEFNIMTNQKDVSTSNDLILRLGTSSDGKLDFGTSKVNVGSGTITSTNNLQQNQWNMIYVIYDNSGSGCAVGVYNTQDGSELISYTASGTNCRDGNDSDSPLQFGGNTAASQYLDGSIDDVMMFYTVLSDSDIQQLYNNGTSLDVVSSYSPTP